MRPTMYKTAEERHEARLKSKKDSYARRQLQEQVKSHTRWRCRRGAAAGTQELLQRLDNLWLTLGYRNRTLQHKFLESYGMSIISEVDREGWDSVKPGCEAGLAEVKDVVKQAYDLRTEARDIDGPLTDQLRDGIASVVDVVDMHIRAWEELLSMMEHGVDTYFDALRYDVAEEPELHSASTSKQTASQLPALPLALKREPPHSSIVRVAHPCTVTRTPSPLSSFGSSLQISSHYTPQYYSQLAQPQSKLHPNFLHLSHLSVNHLILPLFGSSLQISSHYTPQYYSQLAQLTATQLAIMSIHNQPQADEMYGIQIPDVYERVRQIIKTTEEEFR
ncbi:hypothetical protein EV424DRAFT_1549529 [Suillus variegatus]|nr:hypothetical protein EV424DRAFT_1549529 [Suillus variegatus]